MRKKGLAIAVLATSMILSSTFTSLAAWEQQVDGVWKYSENGAYLSGWQWIDGNNDNVAECYYLDADGVMAVNTAIDGYTVNAGGAWTVDGVVQTKAVSSDSNSVTQERNNSSSSATTNANGVPDLSSITNHNVTPIIEDSAGFECGDSTGLPPMQAGTGNTNANGVPDLADIIADVSYADVDNMECGDSTGLPPLH